MFCFFAIYHCIFIVLNMILYFEETSKSQETDSELQELLVSMEDHIIIVKIALVCGFALLDFIPN